MRYFIIADKCTFSAPLASLAGNEDRVVFVLFGAVSRLRRSMRFAGRPLEPFSRLVSFTPGRDDRIIIRLSRGTGNALRKLQAVAPATPTLALHSGGDGFGRAGFPQYPNVAYLDIAGPLGASADESWKLLETRDRMAAMVRAVDPAKPLWVLTQNDPDPDALASAMALSHVLRRHRINTPIVTLKAPTRNENISMISLLGIKVKTVTSAALARAPQVAMVDVQPSYFGGAFGNLRLVVDHHPITEPCAAEFSDIRPGYGATSTILAEYIAAAGLRLNARLATAMYYAIKTDTLLLGRGVSPGDFKAFAALWPLANHALIEQMQRPRLKTREVDVFIRALRGHVVKRGILFARLGKAQKEDIVPRLADFVQQIGDHGVAVVWAEVGKVTTFAARSLLPPVHAGEMMRSAFGHLGSAGGHASMARATMLTSALRADCGGTSGAAFEEAVRKKVLATAMRMKKKALEAKKRNVREG